MGFIQRLKADKGFRNKVIIIWIVIVLIAGNMSENQEKKEASIAECNIYNTQGVILTTGQYQSCKFSGCVPEFKNGPSTWFIGNVDSFLDWFANQVGLQGDVVRCVPFASAGKYIEADSLLEAKSMCSSGRAGIVKDNWFSKDIYSCKSGDDSACTSTERNIGGILDSIWETNDFECKSKFYTVSFAGGFIAMILLIAVL